MGKDKNGDNSEKEEDPLKPFRNKNTGASEHYCSKCRVWYPATSTAHVGH